MADISGKWIGLREVTAAIKRLPEHTRDRVQKVMDTTAFQVTRLAIGKARKRTGKLARSIQWKSNPRWLNAIVGIERGAYYWKFHEYGTVKIEAKPFMRPAKEAMDNDHEQRMLQAMEQSLTQVEREARTNG